MEHDTHSYSADGQSLDTPFSLLTHHRRRSVVDCLSELNPPIDLDELTRAITVQETAAESNEGTGETPGDISLSLHHVHLPKLADADVIDYDAETNTVTSTRTEALTSDRR